MQNIYGTIDEEKLKNTSKDDIDGMFSCWHCVVNEPSTTEPQSNIPLYNFDNYMENFVYTFPDWNSVDPNGQISLSERLQINKDIKNKRKNIIRHFTDEGSYGEKWKPYFDKLLATLRIGDQYINILPGFFDLLLHLVKNEREFAVIFRTFGDMHDIKMVTDEFNLFCEGKHPQYKERIPDELRNRVLYIDSNKFNSKVGYMFRHGHLPSQVHLVTGTIDRPTFLEKLIDQGEISNIQEVVNQAQTVQGIVHTGYDHIYDTVINETQDGSTCSYRDFYYWWNANNEQSHCGKCFVVDPSDEDVLQIFL